MCKRKGNTRFFTQQFIFAHFRRDVLDEDVIIQRSSAHNLKTCNKEVQSLSRMIYINTFSEREGCLLLLLRVLFIVVLIVEFRAQNIFYKKARHWLVYGFKCNAFCLLKISGLLVIHCIFFACTFHD